MNFILLVPALFLMELFGSAPSSINKHLSPEGRHISPKLLLHLKNATTTTTTLLPSSATLSPSTTTTLPSALLQQTSSSPSLPLPNEPSSNSFAFDDDDLQYFDDEELAEGDELQSINRNKTPDELTTEARRDFIRQLTVELLLHRNQTPSENFSLEMIPSMTTLWVMFNTSTTSTSTSASKDKDADKGDLLKLTFQKGQLWIEKSLEGKPAFKDLFQANSKKVNFESSILGSLLSLYSLTGEPMYLKRAQELYEAVYQPILAANYLSKRPTIAHSLEFTFISELILNSREFTASKLQRIGENAFSFYLGTITELGLLRTKSRLMSIVKAPYSHFDTFKAALDYFEAGGGGGGNRTTFTSLGAPVCVNSTELGVAFCRPSTAGVTVLPRMIPARDCDLGAMFALAADRLLKSSQSSKEGEEKEEKKEKKVIKEGGENSNLHFRRFQTPSDLSRVAKYWERAEQLTESCRRMVLLEKKEEKEEEEFTDLLQFSRSSARLAESYFTLWRLTHQLKYREYAWELAQAIKNELSISELSKKGFGEDHHRRQSLNSLLLPKTLKYLFLIFSPDHLLPLEEWTFNGDGQPLPVKRKLKLMRTLTASN